jgi:hypothetical protein
MTPVDHAISSQKKFGGNWKDYIELHDWFDETKAMTGNWTHRMLRHHAFGIQEAIRKFGHVIENSEGREVPTKILGEQHVKEDCGFIPTVSDWGDVIASQPKEWMLKVKTKRISKMEFREDSKNDLTNA